MKNIFLKIRSSSIEFLILSSFSFCSCSLPASSSLCFFVFRKTSVFWILLSSFWSRRCDENDFFFLSFRFTPRNISHAWDTSWDDHRSRVSSKNNNVACFLFEQNLTSSFDIIRFYPRIPLLLPWMPLSTTGSPMRQLPSRTSRTTEDRLDSWQRHSWEMCWEPKTYLKSCVNVRPSVTRCRLVSFLSNNTLTSFLWPRHLCHCQDKKCLLRQDSSSFHFLASYDIESKKGILLKLIT